MRYTNSKTISRSKKMYLPCTKGQMQVCNIHCKQKLQGLETNKWKRSIACKYTL